MIEAEKPAGPPPWRASLWTLLVVLVVARLTLVPGGEPLSGESASFFCILGCGNQGLRDLISNILLFLPVGWVASYWLRPSRSVVVCLLATVAIESLQATVIPGRDSSLRDIISNTIGGGLGTWLYHRWRWIRWPGQRGALRLATAGAAALLTLLTLSGVGIAPAGSALPWYGQWAPDFENFTRYPGTLLDVDLAGQRPSHTRLAEPVAFRQTMREGHPWLTAVVVSGPQPRHPAVIFGVTDSSQAVQVFLLQDRIALLLQVRSRFESWGLRELLVRQPFFPGRSPGDTLTIEAGITDRALTIRSRSGGRDLTTALPLTVGLGWSALLPFRYPVYDEWVVFSAIWLACLVIPVGYWAGRWNPAPAIPALALVLVGGLVAVPYLTSAAPTTRPEWYGAAAGALLGLAAGMFSRRRVPPAEG